MQQFSGIWARWMFFSSIILASTLYGAILHGIDEASFLHAIRLILLVFSGISIGQVFFSFFDDKLIQFYNFLSSAYFIQFVVGFLIYIFFRNSLELWTFLANFGILNLGDSHKGRFVSTYFDPNFFGAIGSIPFIIMYRLHSISPGYKTIVRLFLIILSILLTWSRSGISTLVFLIMLMLFDGSINNRFYLVKNKNIFRLLALFTLVLVSLVVIRDDFYVFYNRFARLHVDESALGRLTSIQYGWNIFSSSPIFGIGYNYLCCVMRGFNKLSSIDSSIFSTFINFGSIISTGFIVLFCLWINRFWRGVKKIKDKNLELYKVSKCFCYYLFIVLIFTCQMNNVLYFSFWLLPMIAIFVYFSLCIQKSKKS
jgi:hypothetical protein